MADQDTNEKGTGGDAPRPDAGPERRDFVQEDMAAKDTLDALCAASEDRNESASARLAVFRAFVRDVDRGETPSRDILEVVSESLRRLTDGSVNFDNKDSREGPVPRALGLSGQKWDPSGQRMLSDKDMRAQSLMAFSSPSMSKRKIAEGEAARTGESLDAVEARLRKFRHLRPTNDPSDPRREPKPTRPLPPSWGGTGKSRP